MSQNSSASVWRHGTLAMTKQHNPLPAKRTEVTVIGVFVGTIAWQTPPAPWYFTQGLDARYHYGRFRKTKEQNIYLFLKKLKFRRNHPEGETEKRWEKEPKAIADKHLLSPPQNKFCATAVQQQLGPADLFQSRRSLCPDFLFFLHPTHTYIYTFDNKRV